MKKKPITKKDLTRARYLCKSLDIRLYFSKLDEDHGSNQSNCVNNITVSIHKSVTRNKFWSSIFHEICHVLYARKGKFSFYHIVKIHEKSKRSSKIKLRRMGWRVERYIEYKAKELMSIFFPLLSYQFSYTNRKSDKQWYQNWLDKNYPIKKS